ncbi:hypothetical protein BDB01DRAFT_221139 [Pilobolus umbonatus]|nr:hypothetical protein BDB01DRAFT_221139 [Pilobolus umbonatus]
MGRLVTVFLPIRLESKNDYLMEKMKDVLQSETSYTSISGTISPSQSDDLLGDIDPNDRLSCINHSLEALIEQGKESLSTHLSLHNGTLLRRVDSFPRFTKINRPERKEQRRNSGSDIITDKEERLIQQRKKQNLRYAHSQHNLSVAMKQLMDTVETNTDPIISKSANLSTPTSHSPHVHHHHYTQSTANIINPLPIINNIQSLPSTPIKSFTDSITSSLINYALNTVGVNQFIYPSRKPQKTINAVNRPVFIRMLFYASLLILSTFNSYPVFSPVNPHYISHGTQLIIQWNQRSKEQCALWIQYIHLLAYVTRFL